MRYTFSSVSINLCLVTDSSQSVRGGLTQNLSEMISLFLVALLCCQQRTYSAPAQDMELLAKELNSIGETENKQLGNTKDNGWLARIVPGFSFFDFLKPIQLEIPVLTLPDLPSYTISLS